MFSSSFFSSIKFYFCSFLHSLFSNFLKFVRWIDDVFPFPPKKKNHWFIFSFVLILFNSFFLNYISSLYSDINLFKFDISNKKLTTEKKKTIFVFKNINLLLTNISFWQVIHNFLLSSYYIEEFLKSYKKSFHLPIILFISIIIAAFTEIFSRYLSSFNISKKMLTTGFFVNYAYFITKFSFIPFFNFNRKTKIFNNSESDFNVFLENLVSEQILEEKEGKLVSHALNLDETKVNSIFKNNFIYFDYFMDVKEIINIHLDNYCSFYPIFKNNIFFGNINMKINHKYLEIEKNNNDLFSWHNKIIELKDVVFVFKNDKLDSVLDKMQKNSTKISIVLEKKRKKGYLNIKKNHIKGIVTIKDIIDYLLFGK